MKSILMLMFVIFAFQAHAQRPGRHWEGRNEGVRLAARLAEDSRDLSEVLKNSYGQLQLNDTARELSQLSDAVRSYRRSLEDVRRNDRWDDEDEWREYRRARRDLWEVIRQFRKTKTTLHNELNTAEENCERGRNSVRDEYELAFTDDTWYANIIRRWSEIVSKVEDLKKTIGNGPSRPARRDHDHDNDRPGRRNGERKIVLGTKNFSDFTSSSDDKKWDYIQTQQRAKCQEWVSKLNNVPANCVDGLKGESVMVGFQLKYRTTVQAIGKFTGRAREESDALREAMVDCKVAGFERCVEQ